MRGFSLLFRILGILLIAFIALLIIARFALDSDYIRDTLRKTAMQSIPGLELGRISGDLWKGFMLHAVVYSDSTLTVTIDSVMVNYHVWGLLNGVGDIQKLDIYRPVVFAKSSDRVDADTTAFQLPIDIRVQSMTVRDGAFRWNDNDLLRSLNIDASGKWEDQTPSVAIEHLEASISGLGLDSTSVQLHGQSAGSVITLEQLVLATGRSLVTGKGSTDLDKESISADLQFSPLSWRDILTIAGDIPLQDDINMSVTLSGRYDALNILLDVRTASYPRISAGMTFSPDSLKAAGTVHTGRTPITFTAATNWSAVSPAVDITVRTVRFDARSIDGFSNFPTSINMNMAARMVNGAVDATIDVGPSTLNNVPLRSANAALRYFDGVVTVSQGSIRSDIIEGDFQLRQRLDDPRDLTNRLNASFMLINLQPFASLAGLDSLAATGSVVATLARDTGGMLRFDAELDLRDVVVDTIRVAHLNSRMQGDISDIPELSGNVNLSDIQFGDMAIPFAGLRAQGRRFNDRIESFVAVETHVSDNLSIIHEGFVVAREGDIQHHGTRLDVLIMSESYRLSEPFNVRYIDSELVVDALRIVGSSGAEVKLDARQRGSKTELDVVISEADLHAINTMAELGADIQGRLSLDATILLVDGSSPVIRFSAQTMNTVISDVAIDSVNIRGTLVNDRLNLNAMAKLENEPWLNLDVSLPFLLEDPINLDEAFFRESVTGQFTLHPMKLESIDGWIKALNLEPIPGTFQGGIVLGGTAGHPTFEGDVRLLRSSVSSVPIDSLGIEFSFDAVDEFIRLASTLVSLGQPAYEIQGRIPFDLDMRRFTPIFNSDADGLDLNIVTRQFDLGALSVFTDPQTIRRLQGQLSGDLRVRGSLNAPKLGGQFGITRASMYLTQQNITVSDIGVVLQFEPGKMVIREGRFKSNGTAQLSGTVDLEGFGIKSLDVSLRGESLRLSDTRNTLVYLSMNTRLQGTIAAPKLTGSLTLDRGHLFMEEFGENQVEQVILSDEDIGFLDGLDLYENLEMEVVFRTTRGFWVRNRSAPEINLELNGELDILKSKGGDILLFGSIGSNQGNVTQLGKRFLVEKGNLTFSGDAANPALAIRSIYELRQPSDIKIWYIISGTVAKPIFTFESDPQMDQQDIVSYTLFSRPFQQLMSWEQTMSGSSSIGNLAVDLLMDRVGELAADRLGLDVIEIDNSRTAGNTGTTIKAGKYLNDRLFIAIFQELGTTSDSQVILEYALRQHLNLILTGSDKRKSGIDIQWKYDY